MINDLTLYFISHIYQLCRIHKNRIQRGLSLCMLPLFMIRDIAQAM